MGDDAGSSLPVGCSRLGGDRRSFGTGRDYLFGTAIFVTAATPEK